MVSRKSIAAILLLSITIIAVVVTAGCVNSEQPAAVTEHSAFTKVADHFYEVTYYDYDDSAMGAYAEVLKKNPTEVGCSAVANENYHAHNFDYTYCDMVTLLVKVPASEKRYASIGVAGWKKDWTPATIEQGLDEASAAFVPYCVVDGINEKGVAVSTNVVQALQLGFTLGTNLGAKNVLYMCLVREVLDHCASAKEAVEYLQSVNIYNPDRRIVELHCMISDPTETYVVEIINNKLVYSKEEPVMTNFYLLADKELRLNGIPLPIGLGLERYDVLSENYDEGKESMDGMAHLMQRAKYSQKYDRNTSPFWYSEYQGGISTDGVSLLTTYSKPEEYENEIAKEIANYEKNARDASLGIWKTLHTSVYDLNNLNMRIYIGENYDKYYEFSL